jgi:hypothetical protein
MAKSPARYVREQVIIAVIVNLLLNALLALLLYRRLAVVPVEGDQSVTNDLLITAFLVPLLVAPSTASTAWRR